MIHLTNDEYEELVRAAENGDELRARIAELEAGIHPAKRPMEGGFSLDKFMSGISKEDAEMLGDMFDQMEAAKRLNGWTPVSNPPEPGHYLTFGSDEGIHTMAYTHKTWFCHGHRETPTHWMPLPEPPTE